MPPRNKASKDDFTGKQVEPIQVHRMPPVSPRQAVYEVLKERISSGIYKPGELLPPIPLLTEMTQGGASINTVTKAIAMLEQEGYTRRVQGVGVYALTEDFWGKTPEDMK